MFDKFDVDYHKDMETKVRIMCLKRYWLLAWTELA